MEAPEPGHADEKPTFPEARPPVPLAYQVPRDRPESERPAPLRTLSGVFAGGLLTVFLSAILFLGINNYVAATNAHEARVDHWIAIAYLLSAAGIGAIVAKWFKRPDWRAAGKWFSLGNLLGAGIAMLIEGICFAAQ
ncbi:MAG TPA: hypothetical protein VFC78_23275 [Tepidisphaeraceae bacterium]|nr:hypothetical protein [Tepidisphaeraceae bacterium]